MAGIKFSHGGNIYEINPAPARRGGVNKDMLDFSANINPLGLSDTVKKKLNKNLETILHYPDPYARDLISQIADYWGISKDNILLGNGSIELIYLITFALRPKKVLIPAPSFSEYEKASRLMGAKVQFVKLKEKESFILHMPKRIEADMVFIGNPNNPTANLLVKNRDNPLFFSGRTIIDEAFMDFLPEERKYTFVHRARKDKKIIVLRTFTKFFALPGLRIGYLVAHKDIVKNLRKYVVPWNINALAQMAAKEALTDKNYIRETRKFIEEERAFLFDEIKNFENLKPYPSVVNFILVKIKNAGITSSVLRKLLIKKGILIRDCSNFRNLDSRYFRIAVRTHKENLKLISALRQIL